MKYFTVVQYLIYPIIKYSLDKVPNGIELATNDSSNATGGESSKNEDFYLQALMEKFHTARTS